MLTDLHIHSIHSDGDLIPAELITRYKKRGFDTIAITDHVDSTNLEIIEKTLEIKENFEGIEVLVGAEITHVPPSKIKETSRELRNRGAEIILVHGETLTEPVPEGTNKAAVNDENIDILAHPGFIKGEEVLKAKKNKVYLELSARRGHSLTNGYVAKKAQKHQAPLIVNTDTHSPSDLFNQEDPYNIAEAAGLEKNIARKVVETNPKKLLSDA